MILNLNFSEMLDIGTVYIKSNLFDYEHNLYVIPESKLNKTSYFLVDKMKMAKEEDLSIVKDKLVLEIYEAIYIKELDFQNEIEFQIVELLMAISNVNLRFEDVMNDVKTSMKDSYLKLRKLLDLSNMNIDEISNICYSFERKILKNTKGKNVYVEDIGYHNLNKTIELYKGGVYN